MKETPYIAIGNDQLESAPELKKSAHCNGCGGTHPVIRSGLGESKHDLAYIHCIEKKKVYLVGINGKDITAVKHSSGKF